MFGLGAGELLVIFIVALLFVGPKKLPELAKGLGKALREFQNAKDELMSEVGRQDKPVEKVPEVTQNEGPVVEVNTDHQEQQEEIKEEEKK